MIALLLSVVAVGQASGLLSIKSRLPIYSYSTQELYLPSVQVESDRGMTVDSVRIKLNINGTYEIIRYDSGACGFSPTSEACSIYYSTN